jgi:hypothetical protein
MNFRSSSKERARCPVVAEAEEEEEEEEEEAGPDARHPGLSVGGGAFGLPCVRLFLLLLLALRPSRPPPLPPPPLPPPPLPELLMS